MQGWARSSCYVGKVFIRELIGAFAQAQIRYCVVGGVAMNLHGVPRMTNRIRSGAGRG